MALTFSLCSDCLPKYQALSYDSSCSYSHNIIPLCSLIWPDEHPQEWHRICCESCRESIMHLANARTQLWKTNAIPEEFHDVWSEAQNIIPNWPGFKRLELTEEQKIALAECAEEIDDLLGAIAEDFPQITFNNKKGGVTEFTARRKQPEQNRKSWWQFWK